MKNEEKILGLYVAHNDVMRPEFCAPFQQGDYVFATECHRVIRIAKDATSGDYVNAEKPNALSVFILMSEEITITKEEILSKLSEVELVPETKTVGENIKCEECDGEGTVMWKYNTYEREYDCPVCYGSGYSSEERKIPTKNMIPDENGEIQLADKLFFVYNINSLLQTMDLIGVDEITMKHNANKPDEQALFYFNKDVDVAVMPKLTNYCK